ncbi:MAG: hypothetical protein KF709_06875 [Gemmatimonadaceae bacterium]|nr:hypothetical protein [Gemmatimonadaceae bacterium]
MRTALLVAATYLVLGSLYIFVSSNFASEASGTVEELERIEILKGLGFIVGSALLIFGLILTALRRSLAEETRARRMQRALHNAERSVLAGTFARTIAHDINNGLSIATMNLGLLRESLEGDRTRTEMADEVSKALKRISEWNRRFFEIGGRELLENAQEIELCSAIEAALALARQHRRARHARIDAALPAEALYVGIDSIIQRAVLNLVLNAAEAAGPDANVHVTLTAGGEGRWILTVEDNGPGISPEVRAHILEPFFTTKPDGTGLGLASVVACARFHGGTVRVDSSPLGGARFTVTLGQVATTHDAPGDLPGA